MLHIRYHTGLRQSVCGQSLKGYSIELRSQGGQVGCSTGSPISLLCPTCIPRDLRNSDIAAILITREHTRVRRISGQRRPGAPPTQSCTCIRERGRPKRRGHTTGERDGAYDSVRRRAPSRTVLLAAGHEHRTEQQLSADSGRERSSHLWTRQR